MQVSSVHISESFCIQIFKRPLIKWDSCHLSCILSPQVMRGCFSIGSSKLMTKVQKKVPHFRPPTWLYMKYQYMQNAIFLVICLVGASVVSFLTLINIQNFLKVSTFNRKKSKKGFRMVKTSLHFQKIYVYLSQVLQKHRLHFQ